jgi:hypothetical protein
MGLNDRFFPGIVGLSCLFESYLTKDHPPVFQTEGCHSETQLALAGLLEIALKVKKRKRLKCPFGYSPSDFNTYSDVADHVLNADFPRHYGRFWCSEVSGFRRQSFAF